MFSNFSESFLPKFPIDGNSSEFGSFGKTSSSSMATFPSGIPVTDPFIGNEPETESESEPEEVVKNPLHETQLFDNSSIKEFGTTLFEEVIKPQLSTVMNSTDEVYKERIDELEDRLSAFRRFMYAKGLEHSYEQWLTKRIRSAKEEDNDEPLSISLQKGMKDVEIMRD